MIKFPCNKEKTVTRAPLIRYEMLVKAQTYRREPQAAVVVIERGPISRAEAPVPSTGASRGE